MDEVLINLNTDNYINGFRTCGLFPWNQDAVNYGKYFKVSETSPKTEISEEFKKFHLKFFEKEIGELKLKRFMEEDVEIEDRSLYKLWKKLKTSANEILDVGNVNTTKETQEEEKDINAPTEDLTKETEMEECDKENNNNSNNLRDKNSDKRHETPTSSILADFTPSEKHEIPTPFKKAFFWPETSKEKNKNKLRERIPSVITGVQGKAYFLKKEKEKERKEKEKEDRKRAREEKKRMKEMEKKNKKNMQKRSQRWSESSSESSVDVPVESEGEGDDWARGPRDSGDEDENYYCPRPLPSDKTDIVSGNFVIILYQERYYPGVVKTVDDIEEKYEISAMCPSGFNTVNFKWPQKEDLLWYPASDIIQKIVPPKSFGTRGFFKVPEMSKYLP